MSKRKLQAIGYEKDFIDLEDDNVYRNFVCEMETRYLQTKDDAWIQSVLKTEKTEEWNKKLNDYFAESGFISFGTRAAAVDCILNSVVEKMFSENADVQKLTSSEYTRLAKPKVQKEVSPAELTHHINDLCKMLHIVPHPDPMVSLEAACIYINKYLNSDYVKEKVAEEKEGKQVKTFDLRSFPSGLPNYNSGIVNAAARILRLLNIETLRETQTKVNETLVAIQNITADKAN